MHDNASIVRICNEVPLHAAVCPWRCVLPALPALSDQHLLAGAVALQPLYLASAPKESTADYNAIWLPM